VSFYINIPLFHLFFDYSCSSPLSVAKSTNEDDESISNNNQLENNIFSCDGLADKCPICFMIFPQAMSVHNRNLHVNEHYKDD
jgi:hypothetical protein